MRVNIGDKVYIPNEKRPYTVRARDDRYIICTKPLVVYFIIDLVDKWRAPDDMIYGFGYEGYETDEECKERLAELQREEIGLSRSKGMPLDIDVE